MDTIIEKGDKHDMDMLGDMFVSMVEKLKDSDPMEYKKAVYKMQVMANGGHLTHDQAKCWVDYMENKDGTKGGHWTYEQTEDVRKQYAPNVMGCDFYAVLNMMYSDYYSSKFDTATYIQLAKDWLMDKDVPMGKTLRYYLFVVKDQVLTIYFAYDILLLDNNIFIF